MSRSRWLEVQGYSVLRFWNNDVLAQTDAVVQKIFACLIARGCPPP